MKIRFEKDILVSALTPAMSAVSNKNTISAIEGILFTTQGDDSCIISSYDLEKGFRMRIPAQVNTEGSYIINAQKLFRIVRMMPDRYVDIEVNDKNLAKITSGKSEFCISAILGSEFPNLPELSGEKGFTLSQGILKQIVNQISHAISSDDQRPVLGGAFFKISRSNLTVVACDGDRLAIRERTCDVSVHREEDEDTQISFIVPGKTLTELLKMISDGDDEISLEFGRKHIIFSFGDKIFFSRLIDGNYIDYERIIPKNNKITVTLDKDEFIDSLERASLVTEDKTMGKILSYVKCSFEGNVLKVSSVSSVSSVYDELETVKEGNDLVIGFNCRYLLDALRAITDSRIKLSLSTALTIMLIEHADETSEDDESEDKEEKSKSEKADDGKYLYMISPVRMKN